MDLPNEILLIIFDMCDITTRITLSRVCTLFRTVDWNKYVSEEYERLPIITRDKIAFGETLTHIDYMCVCRGLRVVSGNYILKRVFLDPEKCFGISLYKNLRLLYQEYREEFKKITKRVRFHLFYVTRDINGKLLDVILEFTRLDTRDSAYPRFFYVFFNDGIPVSIHILRPNYYFSKLRKYVVRLHNNCTIERFRKKRDFIELSETQRERYRLRTEELIYKIERNESPRRDPPFRPQIYLLPKRLFDFERDKLSTKE